MKFNSQFKKRLLGVSLGVYLGVFFIHIGLSGDFPEFNRDGHLTPGHEKLSCTSCHAPGIGTMRQQLQGKVHYLFNLRNNDVTFGHEKVTSQKCLNCHSRPNEQHPIYRFMEPRYAEVRNKIGAQSCLSCHNEHSGSRVSQSLGMNFCKECHADLRLKDDPLEEMDHRKLIKNKNWNSCLGCHDFHGNHKFTVPTKMEDAIPAHYIKEFLRDGPSPYSTEKIYDSKKQ